MDVLSSGIICTPQGTKFGRRLPATWVGVDFHWGICTEARGSSSWGKLHFNQTGFNTDMIRKSDVPICCCSQIPGGFQVQGASPKVSLIRTTPWGKV